LRDGEGLTWLTSAARKTLVTITLLSLVTVAKGGTVEAAHRPAGVGHPRLEAPWGCVTEDDCEFARGYVDGGGRVDYLRHLLQDVRPCEGEWRTVYTNGYVSAFQFTPGTWAAAAKRTGATDPLDPYSVGINVAWLIGELERTGVGPGSTGGWPTCWWRGLAP